MSAFATSLALTDSRVSFTCGDHSSLCAHSHNSTFNSRRYPHRNQLQQHHKAYSTYSFSRNNVTTMSTSTNDLLIVGAGVLGREIADEWRLLHPEATVIGETLTEKSHDELRTLNIQPALSGTTNTIPSYLVFCAPPSGSSDYAATVQSTVSRCDPNTRIVFTSSGSVHGSEAHEITEQTPTGTQGRAGVLAKAEKHVVNHSNGIVVRLSGLYTLNRGAHSYWLRTGTVKTSPHGLLNLIHYRDAAIAVVKALKVSQQQVSKWEQKTLLACVNTPISRYRCCQVAKWHDLWSSYDMPSFPPEDQTETTQQQQRNYDNSWTRSVLDWKPQWESFEVFMREQTVDAGVGSSS